MKHQKGLLSLVLALVLALSLSIPALAAVEDTGFSDVDDSAWYAGAVAYVREKGIMNGTSATTFAPDATTTRGQMAAILHRAAGSPGAAGAAAFSDVPETAYYAQAVRWASANGIITGYSDGTFRANNPVTREQMTTILWRYAGSPAAGTAPLSDSASVSSYAVSAVNWAASNNIVAAVSGTAFQPQSPATRAQIAAAFMNYDRMSPPAAGASGDVKILIAYFTVPETSGVDAVAQASRVVENGEVVGNVEFIANTIQEETGGDIFAIKTVQTYPGEHQALLDFAAAEMAADARPELSARISNLDGYDVIFIGYPIWWDDAPAMIATFLAENDFSGKVVAPFCTSSYSPIDNSLHVFRELAPGAAIAEGLTANSENIIRPWVGQVLAQAVR